MVTGVLGESGVSSGRVLEGAGAGGYGWGWVDVGGCGVWCAVWGWGMWVVRRELGGCAVG